MLTPCVYKPYENAFCDVCWVVFFSFGVVFFLCGVCDVHIILMFIRCNLNRIISSLLMLMVAYVTDVRTLGFPGSQLKYEVRSTHLLW